MEVLKNTGIYPAVMMKPYLDKDSYVENLMELDPVTRAQLMEGNWEVEHGGLVFQKEWFPIIDDLPPGFKRRIRYWDLAATQAKEYAKTGYQPSFTCGCLISKMELDFFIEDMQKIQATSLKVEIIRRTGRIGMAINEICLGRTWNSHSRAILSI